ncbi:MAG: GMC family oxidoreductase N-terminal domain-containing protein [Proteobacteria bacterium]|nr:GMC family oxidoreductase N-terminal domain-containing protein [Pseudomonadota bacterium]
MKSEFDYIVVGSGSAGAALATRLTEDPAVRVLLLEAGPRDRHPLQVMPLAFIKVALGRFGTWQYKTEPEPYLNGRRLDLPRGRVLGGSSSINAMIAIRGPREDFDRWARMGATGWDYDSVLPYFRRLETHWRGASDLHGGDGPVRVTRPESPALLWEPVRDAALAAGYPLCEDPNGPEYDGVSRIESTIGDGQRSSVARAYLRSVMHRSNLVIRTDALTHRVLIANGRATGVQYHCDGQLQTAHAQREVVVCGGAYNTPQLLMLSGIGPADELRALGIEPVVDLPGVGRNLSDHPNILNEYELREHIGLTPYLRMDRAAFNAARWFVDHGGPMAYAGSTANVFVRSLPGLPQPDLQLTCLPVSNHAKLWTPLLQRKPTARLTVRIGHLQPRSRGWVKLRSTNPADAPLIQMNVFQDPYDLEAMVRGLKLSRELFKQSPLRDMIRNEMLPGPGNEDDAAIREHLRANAGHRSHPVGTCRMGVDADAVVDPQLRVRGVEALRVVDASVMPDVTSGNTNLPTIMIGERAADLIRGRTLGPQS